MTSTPTASWNIEEIASKANNDFLLTHEELRAIFMAHVPTTIENYDDFFAEFETKLAAINYDDELQRIKDEVAGGATEVLVQLDLSIDIPGDVTQVPITVKTVVNLQTNEAAAVTEYVISHDVIINGETVSDVKTVTQTALDSVDVFVNITNPATGGDKLTGLKTGNAYHVEVTDASSDPIISGGKSYQLMAVGAMAPLSQGASQFSASKYTTIDNISVIADDTVKVNGSLNPDARKILDDYPNSYLGILDSASQTWALLDEPGPYVTLY